MLCQRMQNTRITAIPKRKSVLPGFGDARNANELSPSNRHPDGQADVRRHRRARVAGRQANLQSHQASSRTFRRWPSATIACSPISGSPQRSSRCATRAVVARPHRRAGEPAGIPRAKGEHHVHVTPIRTAEHLFRHVRDGASKCGRLCAGPTSRSRRCDFPTMLRTAHGPGFSPSMRTSAPRARAVSS